MPKEMMTGLPLWPLTLKMTGLSPVVQMLGFWKPHKGQTMLHREHTWQAHSDSIMEIVWDASGSWLLSAGADHAIKCWEAQTWSLQRGFNEHTDGSCTGLAPWSGMVLPKPAPYASADQSIPV